MHFAPFGLGLLLAASLLLGAVCAGEPAGPGRPQLEVSFPQQAAAGSVETATLEVSNPGPDDITTVIVSFSLVGSPGGTVAEPLVVPGARKRSPSIAAVRPRPRGVSLDGVVFRFGEGSEPLLPPGDELTLEFDIRVPKRLGPSAGSVQVYAGEDPERAQGVRLETEVTP